MYTGTGLELLREQYAKNGNVRIIKVRQTFELVT